MRKIAIFCTNSQFKQNEYTSRVLDWKTDLDFCTDADFYNIVDGNLGADNLDKLSEAGLYTIQISPWLGRLSYDDFRGWKRSYGSALGYLNSRYEYIIHIENDAKIVNKEKFLEYSTKQGMYSGWLQEDDYPESAFQILNNKSAVKTIADIYSRRSGYEDHSCVERRLASLKIFQYPFKVYRCSGRKPIDGFDVLTNCRGYFPPKDTLKPRC